MRKMTNDKAKMSNKIQRSKLKFQIWHLGFDIHLTFGFWHLDLKKRIWRWRQKNSRSSYVTSGVLS